MDGKLKVSQGRAGNPHQRRGAKSCDLGLVRCRAQRRRRESERERVRDRESDRATGTVSCDLSSLVGPIAYQPMLEEALELLSFKPKASRHMHCFVFFLGGGLFP